MTHNHYIVTKCSSVMIVLKVPGRDFELFIPQLYSE